MYKQSIGDIITIATMIPNNKAKISYILSRKINKRLTNFNILRDNLRFSYNIGDIKR